MISNSYHLIIRVKSPEIWANKLVRKRLPRPVNEEENSHKMTGHAVCECTFFMAVCTLAILTRVLALLNNAGDGTTYQHHAQYAARDLICWRVIK